jgi:hypothetical protein
MMRLVPAPLFARAVFTGTIFAGTILTGSILAGPIRTIAFRPIPMRRPFDRFRLLSEVRSRSFRLA